MQAPQLAGDFKDIQAAVAQEATKKRERQKVVAGRIARKLMKVLTKADIAEIVEAQRTKAEGGEGGGRVLF